MRKYVPRTPLETPGRWPRWIGRARGRRATAALEFALAGPLLCLMIGGTADFGLAYYYKATLSNALASGAQYAVLQQFSDTSAVTTDNIKNVVKYSMPAGTTGNLSVLTSPVSGSWNGYTGPGYYCISTSAAPPQLSAGTKATPCADGSLPGYFLQISATYTNTGLMGSFSIPVTQPLSETVLVRTL